MTLEEKAGLTSGKDAWFTKGIDRLGVPSIHMTDGPHGLANGSYDVRVRTFIDNSDIVENDPFVFDSYYGEYSDVVTVSF